MSHRPHLPRAATPRAATPPLRPACLTASVLAAIALTALTVTPAPAQPEPDTHQPPSINQIRFERAAQAQAEGRHRDAGEAFAQLAEDAPEAAIAADALFSAARLYEERLAEPARALELYRLLLARYPQNRTALAARRRAQAIEKQLGPDGADAAVLTQFSAIQQQFAEDDQAASLTALERLLQQNPRWSGAPRALMWLAQLHRRAGRHRAALDRYREIITRWDTWQPSDDEPLFHAYRGAGDMSARLDQYQDAARYYREMPVTNRPARVHSRDDALADLATLELRARLYQLCFAALALITALLLASLRHAAGSRAAAARALWPCPTEVWFMLPIALVLTAAALTTHASIGPAVAIVCGGGLAITWLGGAGLRAAPVSPLRALAHAAAAIVAVAALAYIALHRNHLLDMLAETVRFGPDL